MSSFHNFSAIGILLISNAAITLGQETNQIATETNDVVFDYWHQKPKYVIAVVANKFLNTNAELAFAEVDSARVAALFNGFGYSQLAVLTDTNATRDNFILALETARTKEENALVVIYYSGHGYPDAQKKDIYLQLFGTKSLGPHRGISVSEIVTATRSGGYEGQLCIILDACFSGTGALTKGLTLKEIEHSTIITSSSDNQESLSIALNGGASMSAFTYALLTGVTDDWDSADGDQDGLMRFDELKTYAEGKLREWHSAKKIPKRMKPSYTTTDSHMLVTYDFKKSRNLNSPTRRLLITSILSHELVLRDVRSGIEDILADRLESPLPSPRAIRIASLVTSDFGPYALALKAIAESRFDDANKFLGQASKKKTATKEDISLAKARMELYAGRKHEAIHRYEDALRTELAERKGPFWKFWQPVDPSAVWSMNKLAEIYKAGKKYDRAETLYEEALKIQIKSVGAVDPSLLGILTNYSDLLMTTKQPNKASEVDRHINIVIDEMLW